MLYLFCQVGVAASERAAETGISSSAPFATSPLSAGKGLEAEHMHRVNERCILFARHIPRRAGACSRRPNDLRQGDGRCEAHDAGGYGIRPYRGDGTFHAKATFGAPPSMPPAAARNGTLRYSVATLLTRPFPTRLDRSARCLLQGGVRWNAFGAGRRGRRPLQVRWNIPHQGNGRRILFAHPHR